MTKEEILLQLEEKLLALRNLEFQNDQEEEDLKAEIIALKESVAENEKEEFQAREQKKQEIKELFNSIKDPYFASKKLEEGYSNPALYLKEAIESLDDTKILELKQAYDDALAEIEIDEKKAKAFSVLAKIDTSLLTVDDKKSQLYASYIEEQNKLLSQFRDLIK